MSRETFENVMSYVLQVIIGLVMVGLGFVLIDLGVPVWYAATIAGAGAFSLVASLNRLARFDRDK